MDCTPLLNLQKKAFKLESNHELGQTGVTTKIPNEDMLTADEFLSSNSRNKSAGNAFFSLKSGNKAIVSPIQKPME